MGDSSHHTSDLEFITADEDAWTSEESSSPLMNPSLTEREVKQESRPDRDLIILQQRLRDAAKASIQARAVQPRNEAKPLPVQEVTVPTSNEIRALHADRQHLIAPQVPISRPMKGEVRLKSTSNANACVAVHARQPAPRQNLPHVGPAQLSLQHVESILANLNRQLSMINATKSYEKREPLIREREGSAERIRLKSAAATSNDRDHDGHGSADRKTPPGRYTTSIDRYIPPPKLAALAARNVPATTDRYTPHYPDRETTPSTKRQRDPPPKDDTEVMADIITQVTRLSKRVAGLEGSRSQKRRKGAAEGLSVALVASVEDLLVEAKDVAGYHDRGRLRR
ncbi:MAG: hypothetical protein Q9186_000700 [Xanthomendoza sp. 1 TL-2023]